MMFRKLTTCPIPPDIQDKLHDAGFITVEDLDGLTPHDLSKVSSISAAEALDVLDGVFPKAEKSSEVVELVTLLQLVQEERDLPSIVTFCEGIDNILGGGIPLGKITEICGPPGIGKTQMCLQLCVDVQIPAKFGGVEGEAILIDCEGSCTMRRLEEIAAGCVKHCEETMADMGDVNNFTTESVLSHVYYFGCRDCSQLLAVINVLEDFLASHNQVRLIVIDSIAVHFRHNGENTSRRTRILSGMVQDMVQLADKYKLAMVITNQMTTWLDEKESQLVPALGESWGHGCNIRLLLFSDRSQRYARLMKAIHRPVATAPFQITTDGIRDQVISQVNGIYGHGSPPHKRQRNDF